MDETMKIASNHIQSDQNQSEAPSETFDHLEQLPLEIYEIDSLLNLETRIRQLLTELQTYRAGVIKGSCPDPNVGLLQQQMAVSKALAEQAQRESDKATATAQRSVQEYRGEAKRAAVLQTTLQIVEGECELLRRRIREQVSCEEVRGRQEADYQALLAAHDSARIQFERQLTGLQKTINVLQRNYQLMENDVKKLEGELSAAYCQHEQIKQSTQRQSELLAVTVAKLQRAYEDVAKLSARGGEVKQLGGESGEEVHERAQARLRENELQCQIASERAASEALRAALAQATEAQARLLALLGQAGQPGSGP